MHATKKNHQAITKIQKMRMKLSKRCYIVNVRDGIPSVALRIRRVRTVFSCVYANLDRFLSCFSSLCGLSRNSFINNMVKVRYQATYPIYVTTQSVHWRKLIWFSKLSTLEEKLVSTLIFKSFVIRILVYLKLSQN